MGVLTLPEVDALIDLLEFESDDKLRRIRGKLLALRNLLELMG
jgi:hypothetical protein